MKILYDTIFDWDSGSYSWRNIAEYMTDTLFHGLRSILGDSVIDRTRMWHMYKADKIANPNKFDCIYGRGFSIFGLLPDDSNVDRDDIQSKIENKYFDLIIVTVHCTATARSQEHLIFNYINKVSEFYPSNKLVFIDGLDEAHMDYRKILPQVTYFKRELEDFRDGFNPISFSIPKEKITEVVPIKSKDWGMCIPWQLQTYKFETEQEYYHDYRSSRFGLTCKKGGWDCMRHYEILACACLPYFENIYNCPANILFKFPKHLCLEVLKLQGVRRLAVNNDLLDKTVYDDLNNRFLEYTKNNLTTEVMAKYLIDKVK